MPLAEISRILDDPDFDVPTALRHHRQAPEERIDRHYALLTTIDNTLKRFEDQTMPITDKELYEGFAPEQRDRVRNEASARYGGGVVAGSENRARKMSKEAWATLKAETEAVNQALADMIDRDPADPEVQALIARHYATIEPFYHPTAEVYRGLGSLYVEHLEFRAYYERYALGLPEFMQKAMTRYADHILSSERVA